MNELKRYAYDNTLKKIMKYNPHLFERLKKSKSFKISEIIGYEIIGLEEIFLNIPYIMKCIVNDKKAICYEFSTKNIAEIEKEGNELLFSFVNISINKIILLIKRLENIKNNSLNSEKIQFEYELKINENKINGKEKKIYNVYNEKNNFIKYNNDSNITKKMNKENNNHNIIFDNYTSSKVYTNTEATITNNTNNLLSVDSGESLLNSNNSFNKTKSPIKTSLISNYNLREAIILQKKINQTNNYSRSSSKNFLSTNKTTTNYRQSKFRKNRNNIFLYTKKDDDNKNESETNKDFITKNLFYRTNNNKKDKILLLGKKIINIDCIKQDIDDFLSCDKSNKYVEITQSNINNNDLNDFYNHNIPKQNSFIHGTDLFHKKHFRLSLVPLNKLNIFTENNKSSDEKSNSIDYNKYKDITDFVGTNSYEKFKTIDKFMSISPLPKINLKQGLIKKKNFVMNKEINNKFNKKRHLELQNNNNKIIKKDEGKDMIKEYYNTIKMKGCLSFIPNKEVNTIFMRKFNRKYRDAIKRKKNNFNI